MFRTKRPRFSARNFKSPSGQPETVIVPSWIDVWLPRLSYIAQFGLFVFTLGSLYFTIIPLYQKALLEEAIAKKEIELATMTKTVDHLYVGTRRFVIRDFYIQAMPTCGGLSLIKSGPIVEKEELGQSRQTRAEGLYAIDMPVCFNKLLNETKSLDDLRDADRQVFEKAVLQLVSELVEKRRISMAKYEIAPSEVTEKDMFTLHPDSYRVQALEMIEKWQGGTIDRVARRKLAVSIAREKIGSEYDVAIRDGVRSLSKIKWAFPEEAPKH